MDNLLYIVQGTLLSVVWQPGWRGAWGRMDTRVCMAESSCCPTETITTLLIGFALTQNKMFLKSLPLLDYNSL